MKLTWWERFTFTFAPAWTVRRAAMRTALRNFEAASGSRRTAGWTRNRGDANSVIARAGAELRVLARDLMRNNAWARRARNVVVHNIVGWGAMPTPSVEDRALADRLETLWKSWSSTTDCDADGLRNFAGLQELVASTVVTDGEVIIRRRWRRPTDGFALPFQLQVLEADYLDETKNGQGASGPIIQGVEFNSRGVAIAYWLFDQHPGALRVRSLTSSRVLARDVTHVFRAERPGQARGASWFASIITTLKDLDTFEDGELVRQGVAASFAAFVTDADGMGAGITTDGVAAQQLTVGGVAVEEIQPGAIVSVPSGKDVKFPTPPAVVNADFTTRTLRRAAAGIGITYEDLTGDYSQVNFSSARMGRLAHQANVRSWQNTMMEPLFLHPVWFWAMEAAQWVGLIAEGALPDADWTHAPLPMIDPANEVKASVAAVRAGLSTPDDELRAQGFSPASFWDRYAANFARLDGLKIVIDSDARKMSAVGQAQKVTANDGSAGNSGTSP